MQNTEWITLLRDLLSPHRTTPHPTTYHTTLHSTTHHTTPHTTPHHTHPHRATPHAPTPHHHTALHRITPHHTTPHTTPHYTTPPDRTHTAPAPHHTTSHRLHCTTLHRTKTTPHPHCTTPHHTTSHTTPHHTENIQFQSHNSLGISFSSNSYSLSKHLISNDDMAKLHSNFLPFWRPTVTASCQQSTSTECWNTAGTEYCSLNQRDRGVCDGSAHCHETIKHNIVTHGAVTRLLGH